MVADALTMSTPLSKVRSEVEPLVDALFSGVHDAIYVSTPITTGREYFKVLRSAGSVSSAQRGQFRALNAKHAEKVIKVVRSTFPSRDVIDPLSIDEPESWSQDHFNGFWMLVIGTVVNTVVAVDGWQYSTGCTWEVSKALGDGLQILDERLHPYTAQSIADRLADAGSLIGQDTSWTPAKDEVLRYLLKNRE